MAFRPRSSRFQSTLQSLAPPRVGTSSSSSRFSESSSAKDLSTSSSRISTPPRTTRPLCCSYADYLRIKAMGRAPTPPPPPPPPRPIVHNVATPWDPVPEFSDLSWHSISSSETYQTRTSTGSADSDSNTSALFYPRAAPHLGTNVNFGRAAALPERDNVDAPLRHPILSTALRSPEAPMLSRFAVQRMALDEKRVQAVRSRNRLIDQIMLQEPELIAPRRKVTAAATPRFSPPKRVRSLCMCPPTGKPFWRANCKKCNPPPQKVEPRPLPVPSPEPRLVSSAVIPTTIKTGTSWRQRINNWLDDCDTSFSELNDSILTSRSGSFFGYVGDVLASGFRQSLRSWNDTWTSIWS